MQNEDSAAVAERAVAEFLALSPVADEPGFIRDPLVLNPGDLVTVKVAGGNLKSKFFTSKENGLTHTRTCRIAGVAKSHYYGLGFFVSPLFDGKFPKHRDPFPLYLNEYATTWATFHLTPDLQD